MFNYQNTATPCRLLAILCLGMLTTSCANPTLFKAINNQSSVEKANAQYCSADSADVTLDLTSVRLKRENNIPLKYQGYNNIEGPVWHNGALYYSNMGSHQSDTDGVILSNQATIWRWVKGEMPQVWLDDRTAGTNGLALDSKGNLVAARQLDGSLSLIDWKTKKITAIVAAYNNKRFNSPNDLTIAHDDTIFFTDPNWNTPSNIDPDIIQGGGQPGSIEPGQRVYRVSPEGQVTATAVTKLVPALRDKPNGIILSLDQQQLIVGGLQGLWAFDLSTDQVSNPQQLLDTPVDGLGKDCRGNIYVTTTAPLDQRTDGQVVKVLDKNYNEVGSLTVSGVQIVTNIAFGGEDGKTLFVTSLSSVMDGNQLRQCGDNNCLTAGIYSARLNIPGFPF